MASEVRTLEEIVAAAAAANPQTKAASGTQTPPVPVQVTSGPDMTADLTRQVGLTGRSLAQGAASIPGLLYDPLAATQN